MAIERTLEFQGRKIFYRIVGDGPVVVLLHGMPFTGNLWNGQLETLGGFKFIVPDLPGSGSSEMIDDMSMEGMAEVVKAILDAEPAPPQGPPKEGSTEMRNLLIKDAIKKEKSQIPDTSKAPSSGEILGEVIMIGHSMGGYISLAFGETYPEYLKGLGLFHSTAYPDSEERLAARRKAIESIKSNGAREFLNNMIPNLFSPQSRDKMPGLINQFVAAANNFSAKALVSYYEAMMLRPDRTPVLKNRKIPMLFIAGKYDNAVPLNDLLKLCHLPEISYFHILEDAGHMGMIERAEKSNNILNDYLINVS